MTECQRCPVGFYSTTKGSAKCDACPRSLTTRFPGTINEDECLCGRGFWYRGKSGSCEACNEGMECDEPSKGVRGTLPGFYATPVEDVASLDAMLVFRCYR